MDVITVEHAHPSLRVDAAALVDLARRVAAGEGAAVASLGIVLADHATVLALNQAYLKHDYVTDVLSFNLADEPGAIEGEVYVDLDTAHERHAEFGATFEAEVQRYVVHGLLHLIGYDDDDAAARKHMRTLEDHYLAADR